MALKDLISPTSTPSADRPPAIACDKYAPGEGKRCRHYLANGGCSLPDEFMCSEWLKANGHRERTPTLSSPEPLPAAPALKPGSFLTRQDLASFRQLGVEVEIKSPLGTFWLVPTRTSKDRLELTPEDALTLVNVVQIFGGRITSFARGNTLLADAEPKAPAAAGAFRQPTTSGAECDLAAPNAAGSNRLPPPALAARPTQASLFNSKDGAR